MVNQRAASAFLRLDVGRDAGRGRPLNAAFVNRVLAHWNKKTTNMMMMNCWQVIRFSSFQGGFSASSPVAASPVVTSQ